MQTCSRLDSSTMLLRTVSSLDLLSSCRCSALRNLSAAGSIGYKTHLELNEASQVWKHQLSAFTSKSTKSPESRIEAAYREPPFPGYDTTWVFTTVRLLPQKCLYSVHGERSFKRAIVASKATRGYQGEYPKHCLWIEDYSEDPMH